MSIKTWVTQPQHVYDSFYYYDTVTLNFVRIRLELGRTDKQPFNPNPGVFTNSNRYVGFVDKPNQFDFRDMNLWTVNTKCEIVYKAGTSDQKILDKEPAAGKSTVDFSLLSGEVHPGFVHIGNPIVANNQARLPFNSYGEPVTLEMLQTIAEKMAGSTNGRTLGPSTETEQQLGDKIFELYRILIGSTASKDLRPFSTQLSEAIDFFNDPRYPVVDKDNPYADKDGLIEFIIGTELVDDPVVMTQLVTLKKYLIALTSVVTDYVNRYAAKNGDEFKTDAELWALAMSKLPLMGPTKIDTQSYVRHIKGITIASEFVEFLLDIVAQDGTAALNTFSKFLQNQGEALKIGVESNEDYYNTITIGVSVEVFKVGEEVVYIPKIKQYKVKFDRQNSKWSGACVSYEYVDIKFNYLYAANVFDYEALQDKAIKDDFENFIRGQRKAQIEDSSTFFNGDIPAKDSSLEPYIIK